MEGVVKVLTEEPVVEMVDHFDLGSVAASFQARNWGQEESQSMSLADTGYLHRINRMIS